MSIKYFLLAGKQKLFTQQVYLGFRLRTRKKKNSWLILQSELPNKATEIFLKVASLLLSTFWPLFGATFDLSELPLVSNGISTHSDYN